MFYFIHRTVASQTVFVMRRCIVICVTMQYYNLLSLPASLSSVRVFCWRQQNCVCIFDCLNFMLVVVFFFQESADFAATLLAEFQGLLDDLVASVSCPCHCINYMNMYMYVVYITAPWFLYMYNDATVSYVSHCMYMYVYTVTCTCMHTCLNVVVVAAAQRHRQVWPSLRHPRLVHRLRVSRRPRSLGASSRARVVWRHWAVSLLINSRLCLWLLCLCLKQ